MNEFEQLGKRMSTDAVASLVAMHENSVYRHARELGGVAVPAFIEGYSRS